VQTTGELLVNYAGVIELRVNFAAVLRSPEPGRR